MCLRFNLQTIVTLSCFSSAEDRRESSQASWSLPNPPLNIANLSLRPSPTITRTQDTTFKIAFSLVPPIQSNIIFVNRVELFGEMLSFGPLYKLTDCSLSKVRHCIASTILEIMFKVVFACLFVSVLVRLRKDYFSNFNDIFMKWLKVKDQSHQRSKTP